MSQPSQTTPANLTESRPVTSLTLVVLLLIPCVVVLLLLNCLFLGYKLLLLSKRSGRKTREGVPEEMPLPRLVVSDVAGGAYLSLSEPVLPLPVTSSRASSRDRAGIKHRVRLLRPDGGSGGSGSGSLRAPSSIRAASPPADGFSAAGWWSSAPVLRQPGGSGSESRVQLVPPNSPTDAGRAAPLRRSSTFETLPFDKMVLECEYGDAPPALNLSAVGPGLDSDFGASAGVSLRILSADSDGLSTGALSSALEWDYYDPCYVKQNHIPRHQHPRPAMALKQYWV